MLYCLRTCGGEEPPLVLELFKTKTKGAGCQEGAGPLPTSPPSPSLDSPPPESRPPPAPPTPSKAALFSNTGVVRLVNVEDEEDGQSGGDWRGD